MWGRVVCYVGWFNLCWNEFILSKSLEFGVYLSIRSIWSCKLKIWCGESYICGYFVWIWVVVYWFLECFV